MAHGSLEHRGQLLRLCRRGKAPHHDPPREKRPLPASGHLPPPAGEGIGFAPPAQRGGAGAQRL